MVSVMDLPDDIICMIAPHYREWKLLSITCSNLMERLRYYHKLNRYRFTSQDIQTPVEYKEFIETVGAWSGTGTGSSPMFNSVWRQSLMSNSIFGVTMRVKNYPVLVLTAYNGTIVIFTITEEMSSRNYGGTVHIQLGSLHCRLIMRAGTTFETATMYLHDNYPEIFHQIRIFKKLTVSDCINATAL